MTGSFAGSFAAYFGCLVVFAVGIALLLSTAPCDVSTTAAKAGVSPLRSVVGTSDGTAPTADVPTRPLVGNRGAGQT